MLVHKGCTSGTCIRFDHLRLIATLGGFIGHRGVPKTIWSDHGSNFVEAKGETAKLLKDERSILNVTRFCTSQNIEWKFIPERTPHSEGYGRVLSKALIYISKRY